MIPNAFMASGLLMPPSTTAEAAATFCSYVYLACFPSIASSTSLPNARYTSSHFLTASSGADSILAIAARPSPLSKSSTASRLVSMLCLYLRSACIEKPPISYVQEMGGSSE